MPNESNYWKQWEVPGKLSEACVLGNTTFSWNRASGKILVHPVSGAPFEIGMTAETEQAAKEASKVWGKNNLIN